MISRYGERHSRDTELWGENPGVLRYGGKDNPGIGRYCGKYNPGMLSYGRNTLQVY